MAVAASGVVMNIIDFLVQGMLMVPMYYSKHTDVFVQTTDPVWYIIGDFHHRLRPCMGLSSKFPAVSAPAGKAERCTDYMPEFL